MTEPWIEEPGIYYDVPAEDYHADPVVGKYDEAMDALMPLKRRMGKLREGERGEGAVAGDDGGGKIQI